MPKRIPIFNHEELIKLYDSGVSVESLRHQYQIGRTTVYRILRTAGIDFRGSRKDLEGKKYGRLLVIEEAGRTVFPSGSPKRKYRCHCDCGNEIVVLASSLTTGNTKSCGCYRDEVLLNLHKKHGFNRGKGQRRGTYNSWCAMKERCTNPKNKSYKDYGGRGIKVCDRWLNSFENFLADMGERAKGMTLDRYPDINGNYEPGNCRWATAEEQGRNKRGNIIVEHKNQRMPLAEFAKMYNIPYEKVRLRYRKKKMQLEEILRELL